MPAIADATDPYLIELRHVPDAADRKRLNQERLDYALAFIRELRDNGFASLVANQGSWKADVVHALLTSKDDETIVLDRLEAFARRYFAQGFGYKVFRLPRVKDIPPAE